MIMASEIVVEVCFVALVEVSFKILYVVVTCYMFFLSLVTSPLSFCSWQCGTWQERAQWLAEIGRCARVSHISGCCFV